jgi:hypothetical protein
MASLIETEGLTLDSLSDVQHDTLTLLYPKFDDKIRQARGLGYTDEAISSKLNELESGALRYYDPPQVAEYLGRTPENLRTVRDYTHKTKVDDYEKMFEGKFDRAAIERRVEDARLLQVPDSLLLDDDELYKSFGDRIEKLRKERDGIADYIRSAIYGTGSGTISSASSMVKGAATVVQNFSDSSDLTAAAESLMKMGRAMDRRGQELARYGFDGHDPAFTDKVAQGVGSTLTFFLPGFAAAGAAAKVGAVGKALAFGVSAGGLEAFSEAGNVFEEQLGQGATVEAALKAANMTGLLQFPVNALTDALGGYLGGGGVIRQVLARGLSEMTQESLQGVLSGVLSQRKSDGTPYTWGDLIQAIPSMAQAIPEALWEEGLPAFFSSALIGAGEAAIGRLGRQSARGFDASNAPTDTETGLAPRDVVDQISDSPAISQNQTREAENGLFGVMNYEGENSNIFQIDEEIAAEEAEATRRFLEWNKNEADIGDGARGESAVQEKGEEESPQQSVEALQEQEEQKELQAQEITSNITPEPVPMELLAIDAQPGTLSKLKELARSQLDKLANETFTGIEGEAIRFAPKDGETWDSYFTHLTQGETTPEPGTNLHRAKALWLAEKTIAFPNAVFTQQNGRRAYAKVYADSKNMLHQIIVEIEDDNRVGRVHTSFIARDSKSHKNKALTSLQKRLREAKEIIFPRLGRMRTRPASGSTTQPPSQGGASLQWPGENNIPQQNGNINSSFNDEDIQALASKKPDKYNPLTWGIPEAMKRGKELQSVTMNVRGKFSEQQIAQARQEYNDLYQRVISGNTEIPAQQMPSAGDDSFQVSQSIDPTNGDRVDTVIDRVGNAIPILEDSEDGKFYIFELESSLGFMREKTFTSREQAITYARKWIEKQTEKINSKYKEPENRGLEARYRLTQYLEKTPPPQWSRKAYRQLLDFEWRLNGRLPSTWGLSLEETAKYNQRLNLLGAFFPDNPATWLIQDVASRHSDLQKQLDAIENRFFDSNEESMSPEDEKEVNRLADEIAGFEKIAERDYEAFEASIDQVYGEIRDKVQAWMDSEDVSDDATEDLEDYDVEDDQEEEDDIQALRAHNESQATTWKEKAEASSRTPQTLPASSRADDVSATEENVSSQNQGANEDSQQRLTSDTQRFFEPDMPEPDTDTTREPVSLRDIRRKIEKLVPWRHGKTGKQNLGIFKIKPEVVRSLYRNDLPVIMHELGHFLEKRLRLAKATTPAIEQELAENGLPASGESYSQRQVRGEGIAQFFLHYTVNEPQALAQFPEYYKIFTEALNEHPALKADVEAIKTLVSSYFKQTPEGRLRSAIIRGTDKSNESLADMSQKIWRKFYDSFVDSLSPLRRVTNEIRDKLDLEYLPDDLNIYARARTAAGYKGKADRDMAAFLDVLREMKPEDHNLLSDYFAAMRASDYRANGLEPGLGLSAKEEETIAAAMPEYIKKAAKKLKGLYHETVLKTLVETGIMTEDQLGYLNEKWPNYVPFFRVDTGSNLDRDIGAFLGGKGKGLVNLPNPIKKATGVANEAEVYPIRDPLESMMRNIQVFHGLAARNEVGKTMISVSELEGLGRLAERVDGSGERDDHIFYVWRNGEKEYFATDPDVYSALLSLNESSPVAESLGKLAKIFTLPASVFRAGTTRYNPAFILRNFLRDGLNVAINSESWAPPFWPAIRGLTIIYSDNPNLQAVFDEAVGEGLLRSGITEIQGNSFKALAREIEAAFKEGGMTAKVRRGISSLAEWIGSHNEAVEMAPKIYEYQYLRNKGVPKQEAAKRAREVNLDFNRAGSFGRAYNRSTAFFNASVQGVDKSIRTLTERPGQTLGKTLLYVGVPSLVAWALGNLGDEEDRKEYEEIPRQQKDTFWHFKIGSEWVRIPKPDIFGIAGAILERGLDAAYKKDSAAFRGLDKSLWEAGLPPLVPTLIMPWVEAWANKDSFTGRAIVSQKFDRLPPEMQFGPQTSEVAIQVGRMTGISPLVVDHVMRGTAGTVGGELAKLPDRAVDYFSGDNNREAAKWTEGAFARSLFTDPMRNSESMDRFYEISERTNKAKSGFEVRRKSNQASEPDRDVQFAGLFDSASKNISELRKARTAVQQNPNLEPREKRSRMDEIDEKMIDIARATLEKYDKKGD